MIYKIRYDIIEEEKIRYFRLKFGDISWSEFGLKKLKGEIELSVLEKLDEFAKIQTEIVIYDEKYADKKGYEAYEKFKNYKF